MENLNVHHFYIEHYSLCRRLSLERIIENMEISGTSSPFVISCIINETIQSGNSILIQFPRQKIKSKLKPKSTLSKSPPTSAAFFGVYNKTKSKMEYHAYSENLNQSICHIFAVYMSHSASCIFRAPVDIYRQERRLTELKPFQVLNRLACSSDIGMRLGRQLLSTILRELPFCSIKYPLWEFLKCTLENSKQQQEHCQTYESAICGAIAGGTAAALTMPFDLAFKKVYVDKITPYKKFKLILTIRDIAQENGIKGLFAGVQNRIAMISFGALIFFGCYEQKKRFFHDDE